jgi:hypothetical protein
MNRRQVIQIMGYGLLTLAFPLRLSAQTISPGDTVSFKCLGLLPGPRRYLDGRTHDSTVGLAPDLTRNFSGTQWKIYSAGKDAIALKCLGAIAGPARWLDGNTAMGTVGLAPHTNMPYSGTRWRMVRADKKNPNIVSLQCLGHLDGPRWLDGRTNDSTVWLAPNTQPPYTGTRWEVTRFPVCIDDPCP